ncbi:beta strand repeat-containing protein [Pacificitalea manganoxidans]|nr:autotransporter domain-containing protein [Pacificitalea manganoxidans]MDR6310298.1 hypothetical protein [Pacificitalea manganoxidans]
MTKWKGRAASIAPALLSVSVIALGAGLADAQTVISTELTTPQTIDVDEDVTVTSTGSVRLVGEDSEEAIEIDVDDYTSDVLIDGSLLYLGGTASDSANGLLLQGDLSGTITNNGLIKVDVADDDDVAVYGIHVEGDVSGTITNNGTVDVYGAATDDFVSAVGIDADGVLSGTIRNDGVITVEAREVTDEAYAWGIYVGSVASTALIENNGTISAQAYTFTDSEASAYGIEVHSDLVAGARIINNGVIEAEAESNSSDAYAFGISVNGDVEGDITNTGTISALAMGGTPADTQGAYGVFVDGLVSGTVVNTGTIKADVETFDDNDYVEVFGIYVAGVEPEDESRVSLTSTGRIDNSGTIEISVDVEGLTDTSTIAGIYADGDMDGVIVNSGSIFVTADVRDISESPLFVHGIGVAGALNGTLTNSGDIVINVSAENVDTTEAAITVLGLGVEDEVSGAIVNSGTIDVNLTVTASETATYVDVFGIVAGDIESGGSISNSGTISASLDVFASSLSSSASGTATGILVGDVDGVVSNTGSISAIASVNGSATTGLYAYAYGIEAEQVDGSIISSGSITASATASGTATNDSIFASAYGLDLSDVTGTVANSGAINATAMVSGFSLRGLSASAYGIELDNLSVGAVVSNTGTIEVMASVDGTGIATSETRATLSASAYGIEMGAINGQVYNSGSIDAQASVTGWTKDEISGYAYGIETNSIAEGAILQNDGSVSASVMIDSWSTDASIDASAYGLEIGTINGTVVNNGSIDVSASVAGTGATGMGVWAYGIEMSGINATGALSNSGSIAVEAMAQGYAETDTISAYAGGIVTGTSINGTLMTSGSVDVTAMVDATASTGIYGYAEGISVNQVNSGSVLSNSGTISATAQVEGILTTEFQSNDEQNPSFGERGWPGIYGTAAGLALYDVEGEVNNTGTISATAQTSGLIAVDLDGELDFEGLDDDDRAYIAFIVPFLLQEGFGSSVSASIPLLYANATGVSVGDVEGELLNSGTIMASASAEGTAPFVIAEAVGLATDDVGIDGIVDNSGSILADATAAAGSSALLLLANAGGMDLDVVDGTVTNSGQIEVTSSTSNEENSIVGGRADARGVTVNTVSGTGLVTNTGTISATVSDSDLFAGFLDGEGIFFGPTSDFGFILPGATGLAINTLDGELFNNGAIVTDYNGDVGLAVYVGGGTGSAEFETSSFFAGHLVLGNEQLTVTSVDNSNSIYWTFDEIPATVILDDSDGPQLYRSEDGSVVATVANAGAAIPGQVAADVAGLGFGSVAALLSGAPAPGAIVSRSVTETSRLSTGGVVREAPASAPAASPMGSRGMVFVQGDYVSRTVEDDQNRDLDYDISGLTAGYINRLDNGIGYGVSLSGVRADGTVDTTLGEEGVDSTGVVLGLYGNTALGGGAALTFGASFGRLSNEGTRLVNDNLTPGGVAEIEGDYDSSFISPAVELSYAMQSGNMLIRPYAGYRYTRLNVDGYTESGGTGAVTYDDRDIDVSDFTIGVDASTQAGSGVLTGSLEVLHREVSDDGANVNLFGTDGTIASAATDFTAVELGLGYGIELGTGGIDVKASGLFGNEGVSGYGVSVGYRVSF